MAFNVTFNAAEVAPNVALEPVPAGQYPVMIISTDEKLVKNGEGQSYYEIVMQIVGGDFAGRKIVDRLNVKNKNPDTSRIAQSQFSSICHVTGVMYIKQSSAELHGKPFRVAVVVIPRDDDPSRMQNQIRGYYDTMGYEPGKNPGIPDNVGGAVDPFGNPIAPQQQMQQTQQWQPEPQQQQVQQQTPTFVQQQPQQTQAPITMQQPPVTQQQPMLQPGQTMLQPGQTMMQPGQVMQQVQPQVTQQQMQPQVTQQVQQQQPDPSAIAGSSIPSWATS